MGGGGGGGDPRAIGDISDLEEKAKEELRSGERRNTFISFDYDDADEVNLLRAQARNDKSDIEFIDRSVREPFNSDRIDYLKQKISERIKQASQTVVYVTDKTHKSDWVNWEINKSIELGKKVIAVHKGDTRPTKLPSAITDNSIDVVAWSDLADKL